MSYQFPAFQPMRSIIYGDCPDDEFRHVQYAWLYETHIPDSISQFAPYVTKYAFYEALPVPKEGERFGTHNMQMTEHYWLVNPFCEQVTTHAFTERFPVSLVESQGSLQEGEAEGNLDGDAARKTGGDNGLPPFVFAFLPVWWEEDLKGKGRTLSDGPNYRWQMVLKYPDGVSAEEGDRWFYTSFISYFQKHTCCNRILTSKILDVNEPWFYRAVELWFDGPKEWYQAAVTDACQMMPPAWIDQCAQKVFPYLKPRFEISGIFLMDRPTSDNLTQYQGYTVMR